MASVANRAGARGSRRVESSVVVAVGAEVWLEVSRQGVVFVRLLGEMVRVIAYERRR